MDEEKKVREVIGWRGKEIMSEEIKRKRKREKERPRWTRGK